MRALVHTTLNTGHRRLSVRDEIEPQILTLCGDLVAEILEHGSAAMPHPQGYGLLGTAAITFRSPREHRYHHILTEWLSALGVPFPAGGRCLTTILYRDADYAPLAALSVANHRRCGNSSWAGLHTLARAAGAPLATSAATVQPPCPWLATLLLPRIAEDSAAEWLGDFGRCLAWAWIAYLERTGATDFDELEAHALRAGGPARPI